MNTNHRLLLAAGFWLSFIGLLAAQQAPTTRELAAEIERLSKQILAQQPPEPLPCSYRLEPATVQKVAAAGGPVAFTVTPTPDTEACSWGVTAPDAWAQPDVVDGAAAGKVTVTVAPNTTTEARASTLTIATVAVVIGQSAAETTSGATVSTAAQLTAALLKGGEIRLQPGRYVGNFTISQPTTLIGVETLPFARVAEGATSAVTLTPTETVALVVPEAPRRREDAPGQQPPPVPTQYAAGDNTLEVTASDVTVRGITILSGSIDMSTVLIGSPVNKDISTLPDRVLFDRVEVKADPARGGVRGFDVHARGVTITRSRVTDYWYKGRDAQAVLVVNGPGPTIIEDNFLSASGENVMFGGATTATEAHHPKNPIVRGNTLYKPQSWRALGATVKNAVECKSCDGALIEGNVVDGNWRSGQDGHPFVMTPRNQDNRSPWTVVQNVVIRNNRTINCPEGYFVQILSTDNNAPSKTTRNITLEGNLHTGRAFAVANGGLEGALVMRNNTMPFGTHAWLTFNGEAATYVKPACIIEKNVLRHGRYGINSQSAGQGSTALNAYCASQSITGNVIEESNGTTAYWGRWPKGSGELLPLGGLPPRLDPQTYKYLPGGAGY